MDLIFDHGMGYKIGLVNIRMCILNGVCVTEDDMEQILNLSDFSNEEDLRKLSLGWITLAIKPQHDTLLPPRESLFSVAIA